MVDMKCISKTTLGRRASAILGDNKGTSLVLVTIIAIIIVACIIILRIVTSSLLASADKQYNQDQAYLLATSMGESIDDLIANRKLDLNAYGTTTPPSIPAVPAPAGMSNASVDVEVTPSEDKTAYTVTVTARVANATYVYTAYYTRDKGGTYTRQFI